MAAELEQKAQEFEAAGYTEAASSLREHIKRDLESGILPNNLDKLQPTSDGLKTEYRNAREKEIIEFAQELRVRVGGDLGGDTFLSDLIRHRNKVTGLFETCDEVDKYPLWTNALNELRVSKKDALLITSSLNAASRGVMGTRQVDLKTVGRVREEGYEIIEQLRDMGTSRAIFLSRVFTPIED